MVKLGANHVVRGLNMTGSFDLGTLLAEIEDNRSFSVLVLPGAESMVAVLNPSSWSFESKPVKDNYAEGIGVLTDAAYEDVFTLIDLAALRPIVRTRIDQYGVDVVRIVHGFDMRLAMSGSTASSELDHE